MSHVNAPLLIVLGRAAAVAPILWLLSGEPPAALATLVVFSLAAASDKLDGYLARRLRQVTRLGTFLDPLADKLLIIGTLIALQGRGLVPAWVVALIVARELIVTNLRAIAAARGFSIGASFYGKAKTVTQMLATFALLAMLVVPGQLLFDVAYALLASAVGLTLFSGLDYLAKASWALAGGPVPERWRVPARAEGQGSIHGRAR
ncbi:MAG: CDP-diacylglycerol--glycerol-3-phosphate 3-phosphatidyltransferase [Chloroflexi bacterium]|nr:CDP-diacylglycerol--glycerol-3-phosphate 3-phosphatidyltransferase [Chloroflexota bacterium]